MVDESIPAKLDILIKLQAQGLLSQYDKQKDKIEFLTAAGLSSSLIAEILGTSRNTVSVALSKMKSKT